MERSVLVRRHPCRAGRSQRIEGLYRLRRPHRRIGSLIAGDGWIITGEEVSEVFLHLLYFVM
jgi:hypothetical protein